MKYLVATAQFSEDRRRRHTLTRVWESGRQRLLFVGLNPSVAGEDDDATVRVVVGFADRWGFGGLTMVNLFDWIETDSRKLPVIQQVVLGIADNDERIIRKAQEHGAIWCAWGDGGALWNRASEVVCNLHGEGLIDKAFHIGRTKHGHPCHPLRKSYETPRVPMVARKEQP